MFTYFKIISGIRAIEYFFLRNWPFFLIFGGFMPLYVVLYSSPTAPDLYALGEKSRDMDVKLLSKLLSDLWKSKSVLLITIG